MNVLLLENKNIFLSNAKYFFKKNNINIFIKNNIETYDKFKNFCETNNITHLIYDFRKSYGKNIWNTSYIENKLEENLQYNLIYPLKIANYCKKLNIHFTYIGEGCIFNNSESKKPDLKVSNHSLMNIYCEEILNYLFEDILYLRVRYPITGNFHPGCHIMKLISYENIIDCNNSVSIIDNLLPALIKMLENKEKGIFNFINNNYINSVDTIINLKQNFDSLINFNVITENEHNNIIGNRSNGVFNNNKIIHFCEDKNVSINNSKELITQIINNMRLQCKELKYCLCCREKNHLLLDLKYQPLANEFHLENEINSIYPLRLKYCHNCFHSQLSHSVSPEILFKSYNYVSGTSQTGKDFFKWNANFIHNYFKKSGKILDIACNDGSQLNPFRDLGWETYGVDPAENICPIAKKEGHRILCDFWKDSIAEQLPTMDVITAQNVFAHTPYIDDFLQSCKKVMDDNTSLFIQTSQRDMILNGEFDTIYHEHISFYNTKSMDILTKRNGLVLNRVLEHSIHGRSYIFEIKLVKDDKIYNVDEHLEIENNLGIYNIMTYERFKINSELSISNLKLNIEKYQNNGYKTIGFGAAAKGQTLVCYGDIKLDYIIDESPLKIGTYSPKLNIPIVSLKHFNEDKDEKILIIILAWNFAKEIKEKINKNKGNKNIVIIEKYFPNIIFS
jgi:2-polyprenyl-3-methyl-5-hydroxy-6-metoxy-1,4-benzoquinol methylase